jgi:hypothetical protein
MVLGCSRWRGLTYAGSAALLVEALEILESTGALKPRELPPSPAFESTHDAIERLWRHWDEGDAGSMAANNLCLDTPSDVRRREIEKLKTEMGECKPAVEIYPENLLRGKFRIPCASGFVDVAFTLPPTMAPKVQHLSFAATKSLDANMKAVAEGLASKIGSPPDERLTALAARWIWLPFAVRSGRPDRSVAPAAWGKLSAAMAIRTRACDWNATVHRSNSLLLPTSRVKCGRLPFTAPRAWRAYHDFAKERNSGCSREQAQLRSQPACRIGQVLTLSVISCYARTIAKNGAAGPCSTV